MASRSPSPPAPEPRAYHHGNLREALIEAAVELIERDGLDKLSVREAAKRAGVSPGAPFRHFATKTALLTAVAEQATQRLRTHVEEAVAAASGEVMMHIEFLRNVAGLMTCSGLQLVRFSTEERLQEIMRIHREHGVHINNPHVNIVEDGKAGGPLPPEVIEVKKRFDPLGLLNPGKLRDWPVKAAAAAA